MVMLGFSEIPEYPNYLINEEGRVYSTISNKYLKLSKQSTGYLRFAVRKDGKTHFLLLHRVLCRVYGTLPSLASKLEVDHIDGDKTNNNLSNLQAICGGSHLEKTLKSRGFSKVGYCSCGARLSNNDNTKCYSCYSKTFPSNNISISDLEYWVTEYSWTRASQELGMSDSGLRKYYKRATGKDPKNLKLV